MFNERFVPVLDRELMTVSGGEDVDAMKFSSYLGGYTHDLDPIVVVGGTSRKVTSSTVEPELFASMKSKRTKHSRAHESVLRFKPQMCRKVIPSHSRDQPIKKLSQTDDSILLSCPGSRTRSHTRNTILSSGLHTQLIDDFDVASHVDEVVGAHDTDDSQSEDTPSTDEDSSQEVHDDETASHTDEAHHDDETHPIPDRKWSEESRLAVQDINSAIAHISHHPKLTGDIAQALKTTSEILSDISHEVFVHGSGDFTLSDALF